MFEKLDDPLLWATFPFRTWFNTRIRWSLAASDICFTNRSASLFFSLGQTLPIVRYGAGPFQPSIDDAIRLISDPICAWVHIFPEGKVYQQPECALGIFKWGVARLFLEAAQRSTRLPAVVPVFFHGTQYLMPETRGFPRWIPRLGQGIEARFGAPIQDKLKPFVETWKKLGSDQTKSTIFHDNIRSLLTAELRKHVNRLRQEAGFK
ncbi:hypothetical protein PNEG_02950 [Pneumocystis murina B123]|uniref:Tafazzin family protein n=1 Tax=Pneumocystis murina (strain B123) TaxID=1069680 RepID=M7P4P2_PNEMU|nr:hypothetical protein PNEG_02950 [Pneumocystis murina B123]EMR08780.1 hypothetical protein PNEG_02950 [Pneumocystis murina B123]